MSLNPEEPTDSSAAEFRMPAQFELPGLPPTPEFTPDSDRVSRLGDIALSRGGWGGYLSTEAFVAQQSQAGRLNDLQVAQIRNLGFNGGYRFHDSVSDIFDPELQRLQAGWATQLAMQVIKARNWDTVDALYIGSSTTTPESVTHVHSALEERGVEVKAVRQHSLACQSWTTSVVDALTRLELEGKNVVVVGLDTLSPITDVNDPITYAIFGNGGGAFAFKPGKEIEHLHGITQFEHDREGITTCRLVCQLPPPERRLSYPTSFKVVGEDTRNYLAVTEDSVVMAIEPTETGKLIMNGPGTFRYFVIESNSFDRIQEQLTWYADSDLAALHGELDIPFGHQPSKEVMNGLNAFGIKQYGRRKLSGTPPQFTWVMDKTPYNNISAGTGIVAMEQMAHMGLLKPHSVHLMLGLGIGNSVGAHIVRFI